MRALFLVVVVALSSAIALEIQMPWNHGGLAVKSKMSLNSAGFKTQAVVSPCATPNTCTVAGVDSCSYSATCFPDSTTSSHGTCTFASPYALKACNATCNQAALDQCAAGTTCQGGYCTPLSFYGCSCSTYSQCASQTCTNNVCVPPAGELKHWGWTCAANSECQTGVCTAGKCAAIAAGQACNPYNPFCANGYYCMADATSASGTCVAVKPIGSVCSSDAECPNWANNGPATCDRAPGNATGLCSTVLKAAGQSCNSSGVCALNLRCNPTTLVCESVSSAACDATYGDKVCPFGQKCGCSGGNAMCMTGVSSSCLASTVALASCLNSNPDAGYAQLGLYGPGYNPISGTACGTTYATFLCQCSSVIQGFSPSYFQQFFTCSSSGVGSLRSQTCPSGCLSSGAFPAVSVSLAVLFLLAIALFML